MRRKRVINQLETDRFARRSRQKYIGIQGADDVDLKVEDWDYPGP